MNSHVRVVTRTSDEIAFASSDLSENWHLASSHEDHPEVVAGAGHSWWYVQLLAKSAAETLRGF